MSKIKCSVISSHSKKVAKELGISEATAQTLVSTWQSINSTSNYPNMKQAKELWEKDSKKIELSIPLYVDKPYEEGMLAGTSSDGTITLYHWWEKGGLDLFFDYIQGSQDSDTSKQKQEVFNRLAKEGYTLDRIRELIQEPLDANMFLLWHEMSHVQQGDAEIYWNAEKSKYPNWDTMSKEEKDKLRDYLTPDKVEIEYRATKEALRKLELYKKSNPTVSKPKTSNTINIWHSSNENADLSNFAIRPFYAPAGFDVNFATKFQTVEGAFQAQKLAFANIPIEEKEKINEQLAKASGALAKRIGRSISNLNKSEWDKVSSGTMKMLLLDSFRENPQALQRLLSTGDAVLTHVQESDDSKWKTEFPKLLMEVREELRGQALNADNDLPAKNRKTYSGMITSLKDNQIFVFGSNTEGRHGMGAAATAKRLFGAKQFQAEGLQGQSYAIITKDLTKDDRKNPSRTKEQIKEQIHKLYKFARQNPDKEFLVAYSKDGKNLNYYSNKDMAEMFASEDIPSNIVFEEGFNSLVFNTASINDTVQNNSIRNLGKEYSMYSGNAKGSDKYWRAIAKQYGIGGEDFTPEKLTDEQREEARPKIDEANKSLHRVFPMEPNAKRNKQRTDYSNDLVYRDWLQAKNADTIFAIGKLKGGIVEGGTGWAVQMAINEGKPVYVFSNGKWYSNTDGKWKSSDIPTLTPNFAGIGIEDLDEAGKQAIRDVFTKTFGIAPSNIEESTNKNITVRTFGDSASYDDVMNQYYGQIKPASPSNTSNTTPTISDFSEIESALNAMYQSSAEESSYEYKEELPTVGDNAISVNRDNANAEALRLFSVQKRKDRASLLARQFSEQLDIAYEELMDNLREELNEAIQDADADRIADITTKMDKYNHPEDGRKAVMEAITVEVILDRIKETYKEWLQQSEEELDANYGKGKGEYLLSEYQKVLDYFNFLLEDAALEIEKREGIRLVLSRHSYNNGSKEIEVIGGRAENNINEDNIADQEDSEDEIERRENSEGLGIIKARTVDPHSTVSKRVKRILSSILKEDFEGNIETDDLGEYRYLDEEHAHAVLISELSSMIDSDDFSTIDEDTREIISLPALEKLVPKYPWVNQIINYIYADNDAASKFFADFRKEFIHYYQISEEKRFAVNEELGKDTLYNEAVSNYDSGTKLTDKAVYNADSTINKEKAKEAVIFTDNTINKIKGIRSLTDEGINTLASDISEVMKSLGIDISVSYINTLLETEEGIAELKNSLYSAKKIFSEIDSLDDSIHLIDAMREEYEKIAEILGVVKENGYVASSRIGDATMYSYSSSNYLDGMIKSFKRDDRRDVYLNEEYKKYKWFYEGDKWKNEWLRIIETNNSAREMLETMELKNINGLDYEEWSPNVVRAEFIKQYFSAGYSSSSKTQYAWYNFPIFSDSPLVKFIKFVRYTGDYEAQITPLLRQVVKQELERMKLVKDRKAKGIPTITNFDKNGERFHFFPELNNDTDFINAINKATEEADINRLDAIIDTKIKSLMDTLYQDFYNNSYYLLSEIKPILESNGEISTQEELNDKIREYFWNSVFATTQIIQLTTTDLAYYKNQVDFQKRFKEVYGSGTKLNTNSKYGKKTEKTIYISDEIVTSFSYNEIKKVLESNPNLSKTDREMILTKYRNINVTDAQAYRSPQSFRAVLDMMGIWTDDMERTFQRMEKGEWDIVDFNTVWQTIKPFLYTQIKKPDGLGGVMKVPHQNKNSEFLLLSMYGMIASGIKGSPKLRAINRFMKGFDIDVIQFESAVKVGGQGIINLNYSEDKLAEITNLGYDKFKEAMDKDLDNHKITREEYQKIFDSISMSEEDIYNTLRDNTANGTNPYTVHELPYKDYVIQQPTPEHLFDALAIFGSQFRNLIVSDISDDAEFIVNGKKYNKQELLNLYQALIVENLLDSFEEVRKEFGTESIESLQGALLNQVEGNTKYGRDIVEALQIVEIKHPLTGDTIKVFNIPLSNPTTTNVIQELINSTFKNRITKQKIKGGNCIMVTSYGLTEDLQLRYDDNGNLLGAECYLPASSKEFYEPFMVTKTKIVRGEKVEYKELDVKKLKKAGLDKMVGYRIPTENKYSMLPLIVKGFLPQQNGSAIMLPADITTISGADFDVDKLFLMIPEFKKIKTYNLKEAWDDFYEDNPDEADKVHANQMKAFLSDLQDKADRGELDIDIHDNEALSEAFYDYISDKKSYKFSDTAQKAFSKWFNSRKDNYFIKEEIVKVSYDQNKRPEEQSLASRNNMIIDIAYSILTNKDTGPKLLSPGNFDNVKRMDRIAIITGDVTTFSKALEVFGQTKETIGEFLLNASLDTLDKFVSNYRKLPNPMTLDNFIHFHYQNMIGAKLIGMYANNTTAQAKFQVTGLSITEDYKWIINGRRMDSLHDIYSPLNELISKNCAEFSAASVDNGKDPTLAGLLQNANTAKLTSVMLRAGMTIEEIGLFFNVPYIKDFIRGTEGNLKKLNFYIDSIDTALKELKASDTVEEVSVKEYSSKEMMSLIVNKFEYSTMSEKDKIDYLKRNKEYLLLLQRIGAVSEDISNLTKISRADSPNGAVDISIAGAKMQTRAVELFHRKIDKGQATITGISDVLVKGLINMDMDKSTIRERLLLSRMPVLQAFYSLGIEAANSVTSNYFIQNTEFVNSLIDEICDECTTGMMSKSAIERLYKDLIKFGLTKTSLFGDSENSYEEKRNYYLNSYPNIFLSVKSNNPDIANLGIIRKLSVKNGRIVFNRSARMSINAREAFMRDLDSLLYMDNPEAVKLAVDLFMYSYYKEGLSFGPNNYGYFFSSNFLNSFPEFINTLRSMQYEMVKGSFYDKFKLQYLANNFTSLSLPKVNDFTSVNDESIVVERKDVRNHNKSDGSVYEFVVVSGEKGDYLYKTSPKIGGDYIEYSLVATYGDIYNSYNANKTLEEMRSELAKQSNIRYKNPKAAIEEELSIRTIDDTEYGNFSNIEIDESKLYSHEVSEEVLNELGIPCKNKK